MRELTDKEARFVEEYLIDLNATKAAIRAGYSEHTAKQIGSEVLGKSEVQDAVAQAMAARSERTEVTQDQVIQELRSVAFSDMRDFAEWKDASVRLKDSVELRENVSLAVADVSQSMSQFGPNVRIKLHDKMRALELLGKHLGMFGKDPGEQPGGALVLTPEQLISLATAAKEPK